MGTEYATTEKRIDIRVVAPGKYEIELYQEALLLKSFAVTLPECDNVLTNVRDNEPATLVKIRKDSYYEFWRFSDNLDSVIIGE